jgi:hypothetical protein
MSLPTVFEICGPREDVLNGTIADADFAADLAKVILLFGDGHQDVDAHRNPDLGFDGVHRVAPKTPQVEMTLDPFEEEFDLPAAFIEIGDGLGGQRKVVG